MIFFLTTADTEILALSHAARDLPPGFPTVRAANPAALGDPAALAAFLDAAAGAPLIACPGDQQPDVDLAAACTAPADVVQTVFAYLLHGGVANLRSLLGYMADRLLGYSSAYAPPTELPWEGLYHPDEP